MRTAAVSAQGVQRQETRWRRPDGVTFDVEAVARRRGRRRRNARRQRARRHRRARREAERNEHDQQRVSRLLELAQRAHSLTENEILDRALQLAQDLTQSPIAYLFLVGADVPTVELVARRSGGRGRTADRADALARRTAAGHGAVRMHRLTAPGRARVERGDGLAAPGRAARTS